MPFPRYRQVVHGKSGDRGRWLALRPHLEGLDERALLASITDLGTLGGVAFATGINDSGQVVGDSWLSTAAHSAEHAFLQQAGR